MKRMIDNKEFENLKKDVADINEVVEEHTTNYVITSVLVDDGEVLGSQVKDVENDVTYNLPLGSQVEANPVLEGGESDLSSIEIDGTKYGIGGGGQVYQHNLTIIYTQSGQYQFHICCQFNSDNNTEITTRQALATFLYNKGFTSMTKLLPTTGQFAKQVGANDYKYVTGGLYSDNGTNLYIVGTKVETTGSTVNDGSVALTGFTSFNDVVI